MSFVLLFIVLWTVAVFTEVTIATVSLRGTIYNDGERAAAEYLLYVRLGEKENGSIFWSLTWQADNVKAVKVYI